MAAGKTSSTPHRGPHPPWVTALTTYFGYMLLFIFGYIRDTFRAYMPARYLPPTMIRTTPEGYAPLLADYTDFYTRRLYHRIQDCWNRPISSAAGAYVDVMERDLVPGEGMRMLGTTRHCLNLGSYNYLGFAESEEDIRVSVKKALQEYGAATASGRMELGTTALHIELEERVAKFLHKPAAIVFGMGFATNSTILPALAGEGGLIISDSMNHASIVTGARGSGARIKVFKHNDMKDLERVLRTSIAEGQPRTHRPWSKIVVCVEGIYSMEGEMCSLPEIVAIKNKYKAYLYLDEAHSIGAMGPTGRGIAEHLQVNPDDVDIFMGTFTKSFGSVGGYIASSVDVINHLRRVSPGSTYACSLAPSCAAQVIGVLRILTGEDGTKRGQQKIAQLHRNANLFRRGMELMGCETLGDADSPIVPVMLYNPSKMPAFSRECLKRNIAVVVVGFPATPLITSRVRFCISAAHTEDDIVEALKALDDVSTRVMIKYRYQGRLPPRQSLQLADAPPKKR